METCQVDHFIGVVSLLNCGVGNYADSTSILIAIAIEDSVTGEQGVRPSHC